VRAERHDFLQLLEVAILMEERHAMLLRGTGDEQIRQRHALETERRELSHRAQCGTLNGCRDRDLP
jgi:hypothetical protein